MTTASATAAAAVPPPDLGKYKGVACLYQGDPAGARFGTLTTDRRHLSRPFARHRPAAVVIEACALSGPVHDLRCRLGLTRRVANTASEAWKFRHARRKADRDDAPRLARLRAPGRLPGHAAGQGAVAAAGGGGPGLSPRRHPQACVPATGHPHIVQTGNYRQGAPISDLSHGPYVLRHRAAELVSLLWRRKATGLLARSAIETEDPS
jgi:hypothetical protein